MAVATALEGFLAQQRAGTLAHDDQIFCGTARAPDGARAAVIRSLRQPRLHTGPWTAQCRHPAAPRTVLPSTATTWAAPAIPAHLVMPSDAAPLPQHGAARPLCTRVGYALHMVE